MMRRIGLAVLMIATTAQAQTVTGVVFTDRNGNGVRDAGERGIPRVAVSDQDTVVLTRADGSYTLPAGRGTGIVFVSIPNGYRSVGNFWRRASDPQLFALAESRGQRAASFTFMHASDTHISEQSAPRTRRLRGLADSLRPDFVIITGDLVRDALRVGETEARGYYDLFMRERGAFTLPVFTTPGNHEIFGIETARSAVSPAHPLFGKTMYRSYLGPDYYSFNYGGVHFVALNTADVRGEDYYGHVDSLQLAWLARDLELVPANMPVVTFNHIPFFSTSELMHGFHPEQPAPTLIRIGTRDVFRHTVSNADTTLDVLGRRRHVLALGGHVHMRELLQYEWRGAPRRFENAAAVVAPTKFGAREFPSGVTLYRVRAGVIDSGTFVRLDPR
jgi:hypothetical protein